MKADRTPISPAFRKEWQALLYLGFFVLLFLLPFLLIQSHLISKKDSFLSMYEGLGFFEHDYKEIYQKTSDIDMLFLGGSRVCVGIDTEVVKQRLIATGRLQPSVTNFCHGYAGEDLDYFLLSELLKRRKVHLVVWQTPALNYPYSDWPNPACVIWFMAQDKDMLSAMSSRQWIRMYAQSVFTCLRDVLSLVRSNALATFEVNGEGHRRHGADHKGFGLRADATVRREFQEFNPEPVQLNGSQLFYSTNPKLFKFVDQPIGNYQKQFLIKAIKLLHEHKIPIVFIHMPALYAPDDVVEERVDWRPFLDKTVHLLGVEPKQLFRGLNPQQRELLYQDYGHFNANGSRFFTNAVFQGLFNVYQQTNN